MCFNNIIKKIKYKPNNKIIDVSNIPVIINDNIYIECGICYINFKLEEIPCLNPCGHRSFCKNCLINNKNNLCPFCKTEIKSYINIYEYLFYNNKIDIIL